MPPQPSYNPDRRAAFLERYGVTPKGHAQEAFADLRASDASADAAPPAVAVKVLSPFPDKPPRYGVACGSEQPQMSRKRFIREEIAAGRGVCRYCGIEVRQLPSGQQQPTYGDDFATVDHRVPVSQGGASHEDNYALSCFRCNNMKGWMTEREFRWFIAECPYLRAKTTSEYLQDLGAFPSPVRYELDRPR